MTHITNYQVRHGIGTLQAKRVPIRSINSHLNPAINHPGAIPYHAVFDIQHPSKEDETSLTKANPKNRSEKQTSREKN